MNGNAQTVTASPPSPAWLPQTPVEMYACKKTVIIFKAGCAKPCLTSYYGVLWAYITAKMGISVHLHRRRKGIPRVAFA